ncbi:DUF3325 domain-containing protein [Reyranella sp.]|uniref:DUF3325 domain-containing protein n=1 Tax=Reyranella sp. TaxID=1929291 RepID=UPI003784EF01
MAAALMIALLVAVYCGFALLALSQDRHWQRAGGPLPCPARLIMPMRTLGYGLLLVALVLALMRDGAGFGSLVWATMLSVGALTVVATLTWLAHWLAPLVRILQGLA